MDDAPGISIDRTLDARGKGCPMLMIELNKAVNAMAKGEVLEFLSSEPFSRLDVPAWSERTGNELLEMADGDGLYRFLIRKNDRIRPTNRPRTFQRGT